MKNERDLSKEAFLLLSCIKSCGGRWGLNLPIDVLRGSRVNLYPFCFSFLQWWHTLAACSSFDIMYVLIILSLGMTICDGMHCYVTFTEVMAYRKLLKSPQYFYFRRSKWLNHSDNSQSSWVDGVEEQGMLLARGLHCGVENDPAHLGRCQCFWVEGWCLRPPLMWLWIEQ